MKKPLWTPENGVIETNDTSLLIVELSLNGMANTLNDLLTQHTQWAPTQAVWAMRCLQLLEGIEEETTALKRHLMASAQQAGVSAPQVATIAHVSEATARKTRTTTPPLPPSIDPTNTDKPIWAIDPTSARERAEAVLDSDGGERSRAVEAVGALLGPEVTSAEVEEGTPDSGDGYESEGAEEGKAFTDVSLFEAIDEDQEAAEQPGDKAIVDRAVDYAFSHDAETLERLADS